MVTMPLLIGTVMLIAGISMLSLSIKVVRNPNECVTCGYDLRRLSKMTTNCPECGSFIRDLDRLRRDRNYFWIGMAFILAGPAFAALLIFIQHV